MSLDSDQQVVLTNCQGARSVVAGPGSGKTTTITEFIEKLLASGVPPSEIRAVTFSKSMATTLEQRIKVEGIASTFHSLGYLICSEVERKPVEPELRYRLMCKLVKRWGVDYKELDGFIAMARREGVSPADALSDDREFPYSLAHAYGEYERERAKEGWMDFDSMLADAVKLLEDPRVRSHWQPRYLVVDEAQDTDNAQWRMMQLMAESYGNITVVGDPNQCIYSFRGAQPENITNFERWFPGGRKLYLGRNYRSTQNIVKFIRENAPPDTPKELLDRMIPVRAEKGEPVGLKMYWRDDDEAESALALSQRDPLNSIILARTNSWVGRLQRLCGRFKIRYHLLGETSFWKQNEVRKAVEELKKYPNLSTEAALSIVLPRLRAKYEVDDRTDRDNDAIENLNSLRDYSKEFPQASEFAAYANRMMHRRNDPKGVTISTVHQAKGGEWKNVYLIGANAKNIPHPKGDPLEEWRIWFVAISRARDMLRISFSGTPSLYLERYLTSEILDAMEEKACEVTRLQQQNQLFEGLK